MDISKTKTALYASLSSKKMRQRHRLFLAEGEKCVADTLGAFELECIVALQSWIENNSLNLPVGQHDIVTATEAEIKKISTLSSPPDVIAVFRIPDENDQDITVDNNGLYLLLDGIQDPGNLGTIIRTADWFGFHHIFASRGTVDVFNPKTVQSTMGSLRRVKVTYTDLVPFILNNGFRNIYGTLLDGKNMFSAHLEKSGVIVMGNEGNGISPEIRELVNNPLLIPPYDHNNHGESLNVAIATAITLAKFRN